MNDVAARDRPKKHGTDPRFSAELGTGNGAVPRFSSGVLSTTTRRGDDESTVVVEPTNGVDPHVVTVSRIDVHFTTDVGLRYG